MGSVWGDIDNDGREDVLVYRYGFLTLARNVDGRRFQDITDGVLSLSGADSAGITGHILPIAPAASGRA